MTPPTLLTEWARLLMGSLRRSGLSDVVISPGSRSTPFAWAALHEPGLRCRTIIDERSAAFFAVGHARMTGRPVLLICTSGTAGANYFPAVIEAAEAGVPLLILTADRPLELQHAAAPQTIDQVGLYGDHVRASFELGTPDGDLRALRGLRRVAAQAVLATRAPAPGPVHLNARARKPLEPVDSNTPEDEALRDAVDALLAEVPRAVEPTVAPTEATIRELAASCRRATRGLIVCGPSTPAGAPRPEAVLDFARATGFGVVAEPASQLRFATAEDLVLDAFSVLLDVPGFGAAYRPDLVIQLGRPPTASAWNAALEEWTGVERLVVAPNDWADPWNSASTVVRAPVDETVRALLATLRETDRAEHGCRDDWLTGLREANERAWEVVEASLAKEFSEGAAVRAVVESIPAGGVLALGNSLPIREADLFVSAAPRGLAVWTQRGANGIDGLISGAAGATAASGRPTTLLLGDVSFAHDIGGLAALHDLPAPLRVVVLNNGGGRIFERLPLGRTRGDRAELAAWLTPPRLDIGAAARAFGQSYARATDCESLHGALADLEEGGVLEVVIPEDGTTTHQDRLRQALADALGPSLG